MDYIPEILIAGLSALFASFATHLFDRRKERKYELKEEAAKFEENRKNRPEFKIIDSHDSLDQVGVSIDSKTSDVDVFVTGFKSVNIIGDFVKAVYDETTFYKSNWVSKQFTLKNIGKTVVYEVDIISNLKKDTCIFSREVSGESAIKHGYLSYSVLLDKRIAPEEDFTLRIFYPKDRIAGGLFSAILSIGMRDDNGQYWAQPFFAPEDKIYESSRIDYQEYRAMTRSDDAIECFKKPWLW